MKINDFKLERFFAEHEFTAPLLLCCSDCESLSVSELLQISEGHDALANLRLGYTDSLGHPDLRREIASLYDSISSENVIVFTGAEEGIFLLANSLLGPGDHTVVLYPAYQSLYEVARSTGAEVTLWHLDEATGWSVDLGALQSSLRPNTKLVVINFPHNPTGALIDTPTLKAIGDLCRERGIVLLSDEVYRFSEHDPADRLPCGCDIYERGASLGVMSKSLGLAGLRIGWIASRDPDVIKGLARLKDYTTICNSAPSELLATLAIRHKEKILERTLDIIRGNLVLLDRFFGEHADLFSWVRPKAGPIAFPRLLAGGAEVFCKDLLEKAGVLLLPSTRFEYGDSHFRIGFGRKNFQQALERFESYLGAK